MAYLMICVVALYGLMFVEIPVLYDWFNGSFRAPTLWKF